MAGAAFITSRSTGHSEWPSRTTNQGSESVLVNGNGIHRQGDSWPVHCNSRGECHSGSTSVGSGTVLANGRPVSRIGDSISCGGGIATGSANVLIGD